MQANMYSIEGSMCIRGSRGVIQYYQYIGESFTASLRQRPSYTVYTENINRLIKSVPCFTNVHTSVSPE
jgi:hypothetical protein